MVIKLTTRIWVLIVFLVISVMAINPLMYFERGALIKNVGVNSTMEQAGIVSGEIIKEINRYRVYSLADYSGVMDNIIIEPVQFSVLTDSGTFAYQSKTLDFDIEEIKINNVDISDANTSDINNSNSDEEEVKIIITNVYGNASLAGIKINDTLLEVNGNKITSIDDFNDAKDRIEPRINMVVKTDRNEYILSLNAPPEITIGEIPSTNIKTGLDLRGGARGLVKPEEKVSSKEIDDLILVSKERFNVYGIADVNIRAVTDLSGNNYMLVEVAGATPEDLKELIGEQGKFEAKIGNDTVFIGGKKDIPSVCRNDATCSRIERCVPIKDGYFCEFMFSIYLSEEAAEKQASITDKLEVNESKDGKQYLDKPLDLYLDDNLVDSLMISSDLKGKPSTQIAISGPEYGVDQAEAYENAEKQMLKLQTVLITGSLPFKLEIVKLDSISPLLGKEFTKNIFTVLLVALIAVSFVVFLRYKRIILTLPIILTMLSEIIIILGIASLIKWNLDLASIAGIIAAIGTGVDHQIIIVDESNLSRQYSWKERIKRAFFIIIGAFTTTCVAMLPLWWAGAGLLKGFALTTIIGISVGAFITRPAFADIVSKITRD